MSLPNEPFDKRSVDIQIHFLEHSLQEDERKLNEVNDRLNIAAHNSSALVVKGVIGVVASSVLDQAIQHDVLETVVLHDAVIHDVPESVPDILLGGSLLLMAGGLMARANVAIQRADLNAHTGKFYQNQPYYGKDNV